ncbi:MAG TPA: hypothetical protein VJJ80_01280 [Patescibacteria group bacterium]|nr:hypothetical protein [Patescibacteria group bacterium]
MNKCQIIRWILTSASLLFIVVVAGKITSAYLNGFKLSPIIPLTILALLAFFIFIRIFIDEITISIKVTNRTFHINSTTYSCGVNQARLSFEQYLRSKGAKICQNPAEAEYLMTFKMGPSASLHCLIEDKHNHQGSIICSGEDWPFSIVEAICVFITYNQPPPRSFSQRHG